MGVRTRSLEILVFLGLSLAAQSAPAVPKASLAHLRQIGDPAFKHAHSPTHIEQLADGNLLVAAEDGAARIWNMETGGEILRLDHGDIDVWDAIPLQGGKHIATAGEHVRIWEMATGKMLRQLDHEEDAFRLAAVPDSKLIASGHRDGVVLIRNWETGETVKQLKPDTDDVYTLVVPARDRLISGGDDGVLQLFNLETGEELKKLKPKESTRITTISLSPDHTRIVVNRGKEFSCYKTGDLDRVWQETLADSATIADWSPDGTQVVTCSDHILFLLDTKRGKVLWEQELVFGDHRAVAFSSDGKTIFSGGDQMVYRFDAESGSQLYPDPATPYLRGDAAVGGFSSDGKMLYAGGADRWLHRYEVSSAKHLGAWELGHRVDDLVMVPGGTSVIAADDDGAVTELSAADGEKIAHFAIDDYYDFDVTADAMVLSEHSDGIRRWRRERELGLFGGEDSGFECIGVAAGGKLVATASEDANGVRLWDAASGDLQRTIACEIDSPDDVFVFPEAKIVTLSDGRQLYAWFAPVANELLGHDEEIVALVSALASDGFVDREKAKRGLLALGAGILPHLERIKSTDPEERLQVAQVIRVLREKLSGAMQQVLAAEGTIADFAAHPDGLHWAAVVGVGHTTQLVLGAVDPAKRKFTILQSIADANGPKELRFSADGDLVVTGNANGTLSLYRFQADPTG